MNTLAFETNVLKTHVQASATHTLSHTHTHACTNAHTRVHTASYQGLPSRIYVNMIVLATAVTATYLRNGRYHVEETQKVPRCTTASSVALKWSSRPSK